MKTLLIEDAFRLAGFEVPEGKGITYAQNCGYWDEWPESDHSPVVWWIVMGQVPFLDEFGGWSEQAAEEGMMMSYEGCHFDLSKLPVTVENYNCLPKLVREKFKLEDHEA